MKFAKSLTATEWIIWIVSAVAITVSFFVFKNPNYHYLIGALIGVSALVFVSKGRPLGQLLTVVFAVFYGFAAYSYRYYGEMITYLGMTLPMAVAALISWWRNPYKHKGGEVKVGKLKRGECAVFAALSAIVTVAFYFILRALNTTNVIISTVSVLTSFVASYLTARRSRFYAVAYALNDIVLTLMWTEASISDITYLPMVICFAAFFVLDAYGFVNWSQMKRRQSAGV